MRGRWQCVRSRTSRAPSGLSRGGRSSLFSFLAGGILLIALVSGGAAGTAAKPWSAATLMTLELVVDGSVDPPGDRLDFSVFLMPGEGPLTVEIRALLVRGAGDSLVSPVKARGARNRDPDGHFLLRLELDRAGNSRVREGHVAIPYADLDLPRGVHEIAYEITGYEGREIAFVRATRLTRVTVSERTRRAMRPPPVKTESVVRARRVVALVPGERQRDGTSSIEKREIDLVERTPGRVVPTEAVEVEIPGGFERAEVAGAGGPSLPDETPDAPEATARLDLPWQPLASVWPKRQRLLHFATNRAQARPSEDAGPNGRRRFEAEPAAEVSYGVAVVNFPVQHHKGRLEQRSWWEKPDPKKHFLVESLEFLSREDFLSGVGPNDVLLFVHGFKNTFDDAVLRTAQLAYDLEFPGVPVAFSWPSAGKLDAYERDAQLAQKSVGALAEVLRTLTIGEGDSPIAPAGKSGQGKSGQSPSHIPAAPKTENPGSKPKVHVIAHSMGNRLLLAALYELYDKGHFKPGRSYLGQIVLAAPDMGARTFNNLLPYTVEFSQRVTYYYCSGDAALAMSRKINYYEPVGLLPFFERGLDTINADRANTSFLGHSYFASSRKMLLDIRLALIDGLPPAERMPPLASRSLVFGHDHWSFQAMETKAVAGP